MGHTCSLCQEKKKEKRKKKKDRKNEMMGESLFTGGIRPGPQEQADVFFPSAAAAAAAAPLSPQRQGSHLQP
jgi:hypothetical protein